MPLDAVLVLTEEAYLKLLSLRVAFVGLLLAQRHKILRRVQARNASTRLRCTAHRRPSRAAQLIERPVDRQHRAPLHLQQRRARQSSFEELSRIIFQQLDGVVDSAGFLGSALFACHSRGTEPPRPLACSSTHESLTTPASSTEDDKLRSLPPLVT